MRTSRVIAVDKGNNQLQPKHDWTPGKFVCDFNFRVKITSSSALESSSSSLSLAKVVLLIEASNSYFSDVPIL